MPKKTFVAGEVLTAAEVNTYLMNQAVMTFAGTAARGSAIASPSEGMFTYLEDSDTLEYWDSSAWVEYSPVPEVPGDNLIYNGAMQVAQRGTSETGITTSGYYTADRWDITLTTLGTWTQTIEADGPTGSGFSKSFKMECTTADAAPAANDRLQVIQRFEGQDLQGLKYGSSAAESLTLSFWVKSDTTGTYIIELFSSDGSGAQVSAAYTISSADTWEKKTITIAGDTSNGFDNDNAQSMLLSFYLGAGSDYTSGTLNTAWGSVVTANRAAGQTNLAAATSNYWQVTGVQLEAGTVATPFEHKPYGVELAECQRYYWMLANGDNQIIGTGFYKTSAGMECYISPPVTFRTTPSAEVTSGSGYYSLEGSTTDTFDAFNVFSRNTARMIAVSSGSGISGTEGQAKRFQTENASSYVAFDAEL